MVLPTSGKVFFYKVNITFRFTELLYNIKLDLNWIFMWMSLSLFVCVGVICAVEKRKQKRIGQLQRFSVSYCTLENVQATLQCISFQTHIHKYSLIPQVHRQLHSSHTKEKNNSKKKFYLEMTLSRISEGWSEIHNSQLSHRISLCCQSNQT